MRDATFDIAKVGRQIAYRRKLMNMTQEDLAEKLGVSAQAVSKWENGRTMPEVSLLVALAGILDTSVDGLLMPRAHVATEANFEHTLLPYSSVAEFSGRAWPRSMGKAALFSALKLFMGLEEQRDQLGRQLNDDSEYILQGAYTSTSFGYSYGEDDRLDVYGLSTDIRRREDYSDDDFARIASEHILSGYPVIVFPRVYTDMILATGFSDGGKTLKGLAFLDGDDDKNAAVSFDRLQSYPGWYRDNVDLALVVPAANRSSVESACRRALQRGYDMLRNESHVGDDPLAGYGLVIYDNWCALLEKEHQQDAPAIASAFPHIFIHYESKLRTKQFWELCAHIIPNIDSEALSKAAAKYQQLIKLCEKLMPKLMEEPAADISAVRGKRQNFIRMLQRSRELEQDALTYLACVIGK